MSQDVGFAGTSTGMSGRPDVTGGIDGVDRSWCTHGPRKRRFARRRARRRAIAARLVARSLIVVMVEIAMVPFGPLATILSLSQVIGNGAP